MCRRRIHLHGYLRRFGEVVELEADTVLEAISGLSRVLGLKPDVVKGRTCVSVQGFDTEFKLRAVSDTAELHVVPAFFGGKGAMTIIAGTVLIAIGTAVSFVAPIAGWAMIYTGIGAVLGGMYQTLFPAKSADTKQYYQGAPGNTTQIGTPIPLIFGRRVKVCGQFLSYNVDAVSK